MPEHSRALLSPALRSTDRDAPAHTPSRRTAIAEALRRLAPALPDFERTVVTDRALDSRGLAAARPSEAAWLALVAYVRHAMTDYDQLLVDGYDAESARYFVLEETNAVLAAWGSCRRVKGEAQD